MIKLSRSHTVAFLLALGMTAACAGTKKETYPAAGDTQVVVEGPKGQKGPEPKEMIAGTLTGPLTEQDAIAILRTHQEKFDTCYEQEAIAASMIGSAYVFELGVPPNGIDQPPQLRHRTDPSKFALEHCLTDVMETIDFPPHRGETLKLNVRIQGTMPSSAGAPIALIEAEPMTSQQSSQIQP